jgi:hypothetical protein
MGMSDLLARWALRRPHVLLAVAPAATGTRIAVEAELARRGAVIADSAVDADVLLVVGSPAQELTTALDEVWRQLPGPRARARVTQPAEVEQVLREAVDALAEPAQTADAARRSDEWRDNAMASDGDEKHKGADGGQEEHGGGRHDHHDGSQGEQGESNSHEDHGGAPSDQHGDRHSHGGGGHESHGGGGHEGHGGGMQMPGGLMMAHRRSDRDGLKLDVLQVAFGPILPDWPAGLILELALQGDVVQQVKSRVLSTAAVPGTPFWLAGGPRRYAAAHLDSLGRLLAVTGWAGMAYRVRRLRDGVLADVPADQARAELMSVGRQVRRSRALRWATDGLGVLTDEMAAQLRVVGPAGRAVADGGDVRARWGRWLVEADRLLAGDPVDGLGPRGGSVEGRSGSAALLAAAEQLMVGLDVAAARLVLASFDPDPDELVAAHQPVGAQR